MIHEIAKNYSTVSIYTYILSINIYPIVLQRSPAIKFVTYLNRYISKIVFNEKNGKRCFDRVSVYILYKIIEHDIKLENYLVRRVFIQRAT